MSNTINIFCKKLQNKLTAIKNVIFINISLFVSNAQYKNKDIDNTTEDHMLQIFLYALDNAISKYKLFSICYN